MDRESMSSNKEAKPLLTERQLQILSLRSSGLKQADVASRMGITRQDVAILEKRALRNLRRAAETLEIARAMDIVVHFSVGSGMHILEAAKRIVDRADRSGIKLVDNALTILSAIRAEAGTAIKNGKLSVGLDVYLLPDGKILLRENRGLQARGKVERSQSRRAGRT